MKQLIIGMAVLSMSSVAFASEKPVNVGVDPENGDIAVTIQGDSAGTLFNSLAVMAQPGMGHETLSIAHKTAENVSCSASYHDTTFFADPAKHAEWLKCSSSSGSSDPDAVEKSCGKEPPVGKKWTTYSCQLTLDKNGKAYPAR